MGMALPPRAARLLPRAMEVLRIAQSLGIPVAEIAINWCPRPSRHFRILCFLKVARCRSEIDGSKLDMKAPATPLPPALLDSRLARDASSPVR
jgi:hypothetical protein